MYDGFVLKVPADKLALANRCYYHHPVYRYRNTMIAMDLFRAVEINRYGPISDSHPGHSS